jgi:membrane fusion protein (multidrug efflux system)
MTKKGKIILFSAIGLLIAGMAFYPQIKKHIKSDDIGPMVEKKGGGPANKQPLYVNAQILKPQTLTDNFRSKGLLIPDEEVDLSFETSGKITGIFFNEGATVRKGQLLARVNDKPLQAELKKLESQLPLAQERVFRQKSLLAKDAVSQESYESVTTELEKLKADMELVKARLAQTELRAPFDGVLGLRFVSEGTYASPQTIITKLTKISPLKIEFSVNEKQAGDVRSGTRINFTLENDNNVYQAIVYAVESTLDEKTLSLKVRARYANPGGKLKPGHSATIDIKLREIPNAIVIPSIASVAEMGRDVAYVYKNGKAREVEIKKGIRTASSVQVLEGVQAGDTLLVSGVMQLRDDLPVKISKLVGE